MPLPKGYIPGEAEPRLRDAWLSAGIYRFDPHSTKPVFSIDTPPPTVSGHLHLGHVFSYSHADFIARFQRMQGMSVFYPMGYDDNGLPTERLVEKRLGVTAPQIGRAQFIEICLQISEEEEREYQKLWQRLGLSIDWRHTYRTIDQRSRRINQLSFIDLYHQELAYRAQAPAIWCPECHTALAQADLIDLQRRSEYITLRFDFSDESGSLSVATTRPELLPACVAVFVHPDDERYRGLAGKKLSVPLFGQAVPILEDPSADPEKGTGAVMCCTFGDAADVAWWYKHHLPTLQAIGKDGRMTALVKNLEGLSVEQARSAVKQTLQEAGFVIERQPTMQSIRAHERCDTPIEYVVLRQWFIRLLDHKDSLLEAGDQVIWHPDHMRARYRAWVENLNWDWCISRQRYFGVPFPVWYCKACGAINLADEDQLPVDPSESQPSHPCECGSHEFIPEEDVQDTWATSSLSPQIVGRWPKGELPFTSADPAFTPDLYAQVFPYSLRPQAHEIIRTWAFYTITKSGYQFGAIPWKETLISGWGLAGEGMGKISKSRGDGPMSPMEMIQRYSADALRYWAASAGPGKDALIDEEKIRMGTRLVTKLWNVARFSERFLEGDLDISTAAPGMHGYTPADRWILASLQRLLRRTTELLEASEYAAAKSEIEAFFWNDLADNYLEMCKQRLYDAANPQRHAAQCTLRRTLLNTLQLLAPFMPFITEEIYLGLFSESGPSIHTSAWPKYTLEWEDASALQFGERLVKIATAVRRYKSEHNLPLGSELRRLKLAFMDDAGPDILANLQAAIPDLASITRAREIEIMAGPGPDLQPLAEDAHLFLAIEP